MSGGLSRRGGVVVYVDTDVDVSFLPPTYLLQDILVQSLFYVYNHFMEMTPRQENQPCGSFVNARDNAHFLVAPYYVVQLVVPSIVLVHKNYAL